MKPIRAWMVVDKDGKPSSGLNSLSEDPPVKSWLGRGERVIPVEIRERKPKGGKRHAE